MTSLTLDTIGLCGFGYRFNSFYRDTNHPFVAAMIGALGASMETRGLPLESLIKKDRERHLRADILYMNEMVDRIIQERRAGDDDPAGKPDLLSCMLSGVDRKSGERLDDLNIRYQVITFLIAGHETTSGLLSFATYFLLQNPAVLARAYEEVDRVLGGDPSMAPTYAQVNQLTYIGQVLKESLRLWPTAPVFALSAYKDTTIGGMYKMKKPYQIVVLAPMLHRDPAIWGERADVFDPDHFTREAESRRPANAYKPFGNGQRACIGRQFALQEATLVLGGDCTIGIGTVAGHLAAGEQVGLVYFDTHADLNVPSSVREGALDWMGLAHMLGEEGAAPELVNIGMRTPLLQADQVILFAWGSEQATPFERAVIDRRDISVIPVVEVASGPDQAARRARELIEDRFDRLLVHFDVDVIDFTDVPLSENTGRNEGLAYHHAMSALQTLLASPRLAGLTITELNPDHAEQDAHSIERFAAAIGSGLASAPAIKHG